MDDVVYMAALRGQRLWQVPIRGDTAGDPIAYFTGEPGQLRTVAGARGLAVAVDQQPGRPW